MIRPFLFLGLLLTTSVPVTAHHSFSAEYDDTKPIKVTGVIAKVEWTNPHIWYYIDVKGEDGKIVTYGFSSSAPGQLMRRGIMKSALPIGATITVEGFRTRDGSTNGFGRKVTYQDGRSVFTGNEATEAR